MQQLQYMGVSLACAGLNARAKRDDCPKGYEAPSFVDVNRQLSRWYNADPKIQDSYCHTFRNVCMDQERFVVYNQAGLQLNP